MSQSERALWLGVRNGLLMSLAAIEVYLGLPRSAPARRERRMASGLSVLRRTDSPGEGRHD